MARNKEISIVIRARNAMAAGLARAGRAMRGFGRSVARIGRRMARTFAAMTAAVIGFAAKAIHSYSVQEKAERSLVAAIDAHGEAGKELLPVLKQVAAATQGETGAADEATLASMARAKALGVATKDLEKYANGVVALKSVGLEGASAERALAMAMQGNFEMLNRYIPALRTTTSEIEKAAIVNDFLRRGYQQQRDELKTVSGQWRVLRGRISDAMENIGEAISKFGGVQRALQRAGDAVQAFGQRVRDWIDSDRFKEVQRAVEGAVNAMRQGGEARAKLWSALSSVLTAAFARGAEMAANVLRAAAPTIGKLIAGSARAAWESLKGVGRSDLAEARRQLKESGDITGQRWTGWFPSSEERQAFHDLAEAEEALVRTRAKEIQKARIMKDLGLDVIEVTEDQTQAQANLDAAIQALIDSMGKYAETAGESTDAHTEAWEKQQSFIDQMKSAWGALTRRRKTLIDELRKHEHEARIKSMQEELSAIQKRKRATEQLARSRVQDVIDQRRAEKDEAKEREKDDQRAQRLAQKEARGIGLSSRDREFLAVRREIAQAEEEFGRLTEEERRMETQLGVAQEGVKRLDAIKDELHQIREQQRQLLTVGG